MTRASGLRKQLGEALNGRVAILGVGNPDRGDDGIGCAVVEALAEADVAAACVNGGCAPENHAGTIAKATPDTVLIVDAAELGGTPGDVRLLAPGDVRPVGLSTHVLSLDLLGDYLRARTGAQIHVLGIQPRRTEAASLSTPCREALEYVVEMLGEVLSSRS